MYPNVWGRAFVAFSQIRHIRRPKSGLYILEEVARERAIAAGAAEDGGIQELAGGTAIGVRFTAGTIASRAGYLSRASFIVARGCIFAHIMLVCFGIATIATAMGAGI